MQHISQLKSRNLWKIWNQYETLRAIVPLDLFEPIIKIVAQSWNPPYLVLQACYLIAEGEDVSHRASVYAKVKAEGEVTHGTEW